VGEDELLSSTRKGRAVINASAPVTAALIVPAVGDHVAVIGQNRKLLVFPISQLNEMARGKGTRLQRYKDGGVSDAKTFAIAEGLTWKDSAGRTFTVAKPELKDWIGNRAEAGRLPPKGFPKSNRFDG
jgi:topoisomerase-4 subunit A